MTVHWLENIRYYSQAYELRDGSPGWHWFCHATLDGEEVFSPPGDSQDHARRLLIFKLEVERDIQTRARRTT